MKNNGRDALSKTVSFSKYARHLSGVSRREQWTEIVDRSKQAHMDKFPSMTDLIQDVFRYVYRMEVLPSMRFLQFAGDAVKQNNVRGFNCGFLKVDSPRAFGETMFLLLSGAGIGYSVQARHVSELPPVEAPRKSGVFRIPDTIQGWAEAIQVLMDAHFGFRDLPEFDYSGLREKGSLLVTSGGRAPGPEPLKVCLNQIARLLARVQGRRKLTTLECHDIMCFIAGAVLAGGIRRSAMIAFFDADDDAMMTCKVGDWWVENPQRGRANNSAVLVRGFVSFEQFKKLLNVTRHSGSGEPGIYWTNDPDCLSNPCGEVALWWDQFCNLSTMDMTKLDTDRKFQRACFAASVIGTMQAAYTDFPYISNSWREHTERDALIGVSMTGCATDRFMDLDLTAGAESVTWANLATARAIGINPAQRLTCLKPEGTTSLLLGTSSGIHPWHAAFYIRRMQFSRAEPIAQFFLDRYPEACEPWWEDPDGSVVVSFPVAAPQGANFEKNPLTLMKQVRYIYDSWIVPGHFGGPNSHSVSFTLPCAEGDWDEVINDLWWSRESYNGATMYPLDGSTYRQAPFEEIERETFEKLENVFSGFSLDGLVEESDLTDIQGEVACAGGACEVAW